MSGSHEVLAELADRAAAREARKRRRAAPAERRKIADEQPLATRLGTLVEIAAGRDYSPSEGIVRWISTAPDGTEIEAALTVADLAPLHRAVMARDEQGDR